MVHQLYVNWYHIFQLYRFFKSYSGIYTKKAHTRAPLLLLLKLTTDNTDNFTFLKNDLKFLFERNLAS